MAPRSRCNRVSGQGAGRRKCRAQFVELTRTNSCYLSSPEQLMAEQFAFMLTDSRWPAPIPSPRDSIGMRSRKL